MYQDETLTCRDCGKEFVFTASEQAFYAEKGFQNKPRRCPECRAAFRAQNGGARSPIIVSRATKSGWLVGRKLTA